MKNKFENIKVGDILYIEKNVVYGWQKVNSYFIPFTVSKITEHQFVGDNGMRFAKKNGHVIGGSGRCYFEGENVGFRYNELVSDETQKMNFFIEKIKIEKIINDMAQSIKIELNSKIEIEELNKIKKQLEIILEKIK